MSGCFFPNVSNPCLFSGDTENIVFCVFLGIFVCVCSFMRIHVLCVFVPTMIHNTLSLTQKKEESIESFFLPARACLFLTLRVVSDVRPPPVLGVDMCDKP